MVAQTGEGHSIGLAQSEEFDCPELQFIGLKARNQGQPTASIEAIAVPEQPPMVRPAS